MVYEFNLTPITAIFLGLSIVLTIVLFFVMRYDRLKGETQQLLLPALVFISTLLGFGLISTLNDTNTSEQPTSFTDQQVSLILQDAIKDHLGSGLSAIHQLASSWSLKNRLSYEEWSTNTRSILQKQSPITTMRWLDSTFQARWLERRQNVEYIKRFDDILCDDYRILLRQAADNKAILFGSLVRLDEGETMLMTFTPVHRRGRFDGFFLTTFNITRLISILQKETSASNHIFQLQLNGEPVFATPASNDADANTPSLEEHFSLFDQSWILTLQQKTDQTPVNLWVDDHIQTLLIGSVIALLLACLVYAMSHRSNGTSAQTSNEEQLLHYIKNTPVAVAMFDINMRYIKASDRWLQDYKLTESEVIGKSHYEIFPEVPINHPQWLEMHWQAINGNAIKSEEAIVVSTDGQAEWLRYELHPWHDSNGELGGVIMLTENITERKTSEKLKDEFISNVNHELRTPLTSIQGALALLKAKLSGDLDTQGRRLLDISYDNCIRLTELVNDFLDMEKIAAGKIRVEVKSEEMNKLVKDAVELNRPFATTNDIDLEFHSELEEIYCNVDANRFSQALTNLISNAVKFTMRFDTVEIRIHQKNPDQIIISVADNGPGIEDEFKEKIFEKFTQGDGSSTKAKDGSGLGLNITKSIINAFNGQVTLETELNSGSTFSIVLPVINPEEERRAA